MAATTMDDKQFRDRADQALQDLQQRLLSACDQYPFDADFNNGALTIDFEDTPTRFVVSPNSPVKQVWVAAHLKSYKLDWDPAKNAFVADGKTLVDLMSEAISKELKEDVKI